MKLVLLYDEFMCPPQGIEATPVYILDTNLHRDYEVSEKVLKYRHFLAKEAGAEIHEGDTYQILETMHKIKPISEIISKTTFRTEYKQLFEKIQNTYPLRLLPDYFLSTENSILPAKRFFQYWNKIQKQLKY
jgi:hypothetical protein